MHGNLKWSCILIQYCSHKSHKNKIYNKECTKNVGKNFKLLSSSVVSISFNGRKRRGGLASFGLLKYALMFVLCSWRGVISWAVLGSWSKTSVLEAICRRDLLVLGCRKEYLFHLFHLVFIFLLCYMFERSWLSFHLELCCAVNTSRSWVIVPDSASGWCVSGWLWLLAMVLMFLWQCFKHWKI